MGDQEIIQLYFDRNEQAVAETERKYGGYCYTLAYSILGNKEDAEEIVSDTWLRVWNSVPPQRPKALKLYLAKITRNLAFNTYRRRRTQKRGGGEMELVLDELESCIPAPGGVQDDLNAQELGNVIQVFLSSQSQRDRGIFVSRYFHVEECSAIARRYGLTEGNVHRILSRMRSKMKNYLAKEGYEV